MNNQAAQTMPLPASRGYLHLHNTGGVSQVYGYTADQMHQYARDYAAALSQTAGVVEPNGKLVGWWNGIMPDVTERSPYGPSVRWGADAEDSAHDIPLYDGYNPIHYRQPDAIAAAPAASGEEVDPSTCIHKFGHDGRVCLRCGWNFRENGDPPNPPSAASVSEDAAFEAWFSGKQGKAYDGMWSFARAAWMKRAALEQALTQQRGEAVGFRSRLKDGGKKWEYVDHRSPDSFELRECVIEPLYTTPQPSADAVREDSARLDWIESQIREYGDGYTEPREAGWAIQWQQERPDHYWPGLRAWIDEERRRASGDELESLLGRGGNKINGDENELS